MTWSCVRPLAEPDARVGGRSVYGDGHAAERIVGRLLADLDGS